MALIMGYQFNDDQKLTYKYTHCELRTGDIRIRYLSWKAVHGVDTLHNTNGTTVSVTPYDASWQQWLAQL